MPATSQRWSRHVLDLVGDAPPDDWGADAPDHHGGDDDPHERGSSTTTTVVSGLTPAGLEPGGDRALDVAVPRLVRARVGLQTGEVTELGTDVREGGVRTTELLELGEDAAPVVLGGLLVDAVHLGELGQVLEHLAVQLTVLVGPVLDGRGLVLPVTAGVVDAELLEHRVEHVVHLVDEPLVGVLDGVLDAPRGVELVLVVAEIPDDLPLLGGELDTSTRCTLGGRGGVAGSEGGEVADVGLLARLHGLLAGRQDGGDRPDELVRNGAGLDAVLHE